MEIVSGQVGIKMCQDKYFGEKWKIGDRPNIFFSSSFTLRQGFLRRGLITVVLKQPRTMPVLREVFKMLVFKILAISFVLLSFVKRGICKI